MKAHMLIFCALVLAAVSGTVSAEPIVLKFQPEPGDVQAYEVLLNLNMEVAATQGKTTESTTMKMQVGMGAALECISSDENGFICEACFFTPKAEMDMTMANTHVRAVMDSTGMKMYTDDKLVKSVRWSDFSDPSMPNIGELLTMRIRCRIGTNGELIEVVDKEKLAGQFPGMDFNQIMGGQVVFPSYPIDIGDSWEATIETDLNNGMGCGIDAGKVENVFTYTLRKVGKYRGVRCAVIDVNGTTKTKKKDANVALDQAIKGVTIVEVDTGKVMYAKADIEQKIDGKVAGTEVKLNSTGDIEVRYTGGQIPRETVQQDRLAQIDPALLKALNEIRVSIVLTDRIKIDDAFYELEDTVLVNGFELRLLKFSEDKIYLKDDKSGIIYKIVVNFRGEVTSVKPLWGKQG